MFKAPDTGPISQFGFGKPGSPHWQHHAGETLSYNASRLAQAAVYLRQSGPLYLRALPLAEVEGLLMGFVQDNYGHISHETWLVKFSESYAERVSAVAKQSLALALENSSIFKPKPAVTLFPLVPIRTEFDFVSDTFFWVRPTSLTTKLLRDLVPPSYIQSENFPPTSVFKGKSRTPASWLGVWSPGERAARKGRAAILGAFALTPHHRYMFSGRTMFGGHCTIDGGVSYTLGGDPHTPALFSDAILTEADKGWLEKLAAMVASPDKATLRKVRALEYFYRAWPLEPAERFPIHFMALDALFGQPDDSTKTVIGALQHVLGTHISYDRLRDLMHMRASVIHGGSPDIYDSSKYPKYYRDYDSNPIVDLELLVVASLRKVLFEGALIQHADPNAALIAELKAKGKLSSKPQPPTILDPL